MVRDCGGAEAARPHARRGAQYGERINFFSGVVARASAMLPVLLFPMLAIEPLGVQRVGVLLTTLSLLGIVGMADLGASTSVVTRVARSATGGREARSHQAQADALALAIVMGCITAVAGICIGFSGVGRFVFPHSSPALQEEATLAIATFVFTNGIHMPLQVAYRIRHALHEGHFANTWQSVAAVLNFVAGLALLHNGHGVPAVVAALMSGSVLLGLLHAAIHLRRNPSTRVALKNIRPREILSYIHYSAPYFGTQVIFAISYSLDSVLVAMLLGAESAARYALVDRLFSAITVLVSIRTLRLWTLFSSFIGSDKPSHATRLLRSEVVKLSIIASALATVLALSFPLLSSRLGLHAGDVTVLALVGMALWRVIESAGGAIAVFIYSVDAARFVVIIGTVTALIALALKYILCQRFGIGAIPISMSMVYVGCSLIPCILFIRFWGRHIANSQTPT